MPDEMPPALRLIACREADGDTWSFFLINDAAEPLDWAVLREVTYEWGDNEVGKDVANVRIEGLAPGAHTLIWRGGGDAAELRQNFILDVEMSCAAAALLFEFPRLYKKTDLPMAPGFHRPGWTASLMLLRRP